MLSSAISVHVCTTVRPVKSTRGYCLMRTSHTACYSDPVPRSSAPHDVSDLGKLCPQPRRTCFVVAMLRLRDEYCRALCRRLASCYVCAEHGSRDGNLTTVFFRYLPKPLISDSTRTRRWLRTVCVHPSCEVSGFSIIPPGISWLILSPVRRHFESRTLYKSA